MKYLLLVAIVIAAFSRWQLGEARDAIESARVRADSIAGEAVVEKVRADSVWSVRFAGQADDLGQDLAKRDDDLGQLATDLAGANVRIGLLAEVNASARGSIVSLSDRVGALLDAQGDTVSVEGSWGGDLDDGLLTGSWGFVLPAAEHRLSYGVTLPGEIVTSVTGDGRTIIAVRSTNPLATFVIGETFVDPPDPVEVPRLSLTRAALAFGLGVLGWELAR